MICIPIMARNNAEALPSIAEAVPLADLLEIRLDVMETFDLSEMIKASSKPVLVTYRTRGQGGEGSANHSTQLGHLMDAIETGADFVDIEYALPPEFRERLFRHRGGSRLILSTHLPEGTPSCEDLDGILRKMAATGADILKIVTYAGSWEDNLRVLGLIPKARDQGIKIIAFCMGPRGKIGRVLAHLMGGYITFASLGQGQESASGQLSLHDMNQLVEVFSS